MKILKNIIKYSLTIILLLVLVINIYSFIELKVKHKDLASINGYGVAEVVSGSMEPTISIGDLIIVNTKIHDYNVNDIITFKDVTGSLVTHRIIDITDGGIITKGDNNESKDTGYLNPEMIRGVYVSKLSHMGAVISSLKNPITLITVFVIGIVICIVTSIDEDGNPITLSKEELEFIEYKKMKETKKVATKPSTKKATTKAETKKVATKPSTKKTTTKSETKKVATKPSTKKATTKAENKKVETKPSTKKTTTKAETKKVAAKPSTKKTTTKAETKKVATKPSTKKATTKSETKKVAAKPSTKKATTKSKTKKVATKPSTKKTTTKVENK